MENDNEFNNKFSSIERFVYWLADKLSYGNDDNIMLSYEDVVGELMLEVAKGLNVYKDKPLNELLAILRRMCDARVSELKLKYYMTHRVMFKVTLSLDVEDLGEWIPSDGGNP